MIIAVYKSKTRKISYSVIEDENCFVIETEVLGGSKKEKTLLSCCTEEKAIKTAKLFAKSEVHPLHIEDIISDLRF